MASEGEFRPNFALDAIKAHNVRDSRLAVVTADQEIWEQRLRGPRNQSALITDDMRTWARFLRRETVKRGGSTIDTSASDLAKNLNGMAALINPMLMQRLEAMGGL